MEAYFDAFITAVADGEVAIKDGQFAWERFTTGGGTYRSRTRRSSRLIVTTPAGPSRRCIGSGESLDTRLVMFCYGARHPMVRSRWGPMGPGERQGGVAPHPGRVGPHRDGSWGEGTASLNNQGPTNRRGIH